jgi:mutator protein MutT
MKTDSSTLSRPVIEVALGILLRRVRGQDQVLITKRKAGAVLGGFWEFPGGKIEPAEEPREALVREFAEELGIRIRVNKPLPIIEHRYDHGRVRLHPFFCTRLTGVVRDLQVAEHRWVSPGELVRYEFPPANSRLIMALTQGFNKGISTCLS